MHQVYTKYDPAQSYEWNYEHAPAPPSPNAEPSQRNFQNADKETAHWQICGLPVASPLGISAGPLLNGRWVLHYAALGFDILTYKTVRSRSRACYEPPNLQPVGVDQVSAGQTIDACDTMRGSWAISFGMPSREPDIWTRDVAWTRQQLAPSKKLVVSVVATAEPSWSLQQVAEDYAECARMAGESGADAVELNFSCPNVQSVDGQLYQDTSAAMTVAQRVRDRVPHLPLIVKIGLVTGPDQARRLLEVLHVNIDAISMTNCIACRVTKQGDALFDGQPRGIGGAAIRRQSISQVALFAKIREQLGLPMELVGVGGISEPEHVQAYLQAGASTIQLATAAMTNPAVGKKLRAALSAQRMQ